MPERRPQKDVPASHTPAGAIWSGTITFGLVSVAVDLFSGLRPTNRRLRLLSCDGAPLRRQYYCPADNTSLQREEVVRGFELDSGKFVRVSDEELGGLAPKKSREIDLQRFVSRDAIDPILFDRPYILAPRGESVKAYRLLTAAMQSKRRAGIATFVMRGREYLVALLADHDLLRAETLRFGSELRAAEDVAGISAQSVDAKLVASLHRTIKAQVTDKLPLEELRDEDALRLRKLVDKKRRNGQDVVKLAETTGDDDDEEGGEVVDILALLKARMAAGNAQTSHPAGKTVPPKRRARTGPVSKR